MAKRIYPLNGLKYWWAYDFDEICEIYKKYKLHPQTIRHWIRDGLPTMKGRPYLIYGFELIKFLGRINKSNKCQTEFYQIFCMKCKQGKAPYKKQLQLEHKDGFVKAKGQCVTCKSIMYKSYKLYDFQKLKREFHTVDVLELYDCEDSTLKTQLVASPKTQRNEPVIRDLFP